MPSSASHYFYVFVAQENKVKQGGISVLAAGAPCYWLIDNLDNQHMFQ